MPKSSGRQCAWDDIGSNATLERLLEEAPDATNKASLRAALTSKSGAWLHALPSPNLGTFLDDNSLRMTIALWLSCNVCESHLCIYGSTVEASGYHGLNCQRSCGKFLRHHVLNHIIWRTLIFTNVRCTLEPSGFSRSDAGLWDSEAKSFIRALGRKLRNKRSVLHFGCYLFESLSVAIHYGNAASVIRLDQGRHFCHLSVIFRYHREFRLFLRCDRLPSVQSPGPLFSLVCYCVAVFLRAAFRSVGLRACTSVWGAAQRKPRGGSYATGVRPGDKLRYPAVCTPSPHTVSAPRLPKRSKPRDLVAIFNTCLKNCYFPPAWKEAEVIGIHKPGKPHNLPASYRPISLLSGLGKLFEKILKTRLSDHLLGKGLIIDEQFGFRPAHSCPQQVLRLVEYVSEGFETERSTVAVFFDVAKAFDRVYPLVRSSILAPLLHPAAANRLRPGRREGNRPVTVSLRHPMPRRLPPDVVHSACHAPSALACAVWPHSEEFFSGFQSHTTHAYGCEGVQDKHFLPPPRRKRPQEDDGLPKKICKECTRQLKRTYNFNILCEDSDRKLRSTLLPKYQCIQSAKEVKDEVKEEMCDVPTVQNKEEACNRDKDTKENVKTGLSLSPYPRNFTQWQIKEWKREELTFLCVFTLSATVV
ncbi:Probable RNA-directed DNA polymerase from transposon BS [Eumeta japonica]|uniref:Probable RNA-directed DNA polymerase from transposon BS n=1 Tax=Eumeta variegata TaxID=151549 RepID=A0A4C1YZC1_EUMVA|nr:Probable RNA-directed DNA polymerase from transposon BS [Eumeta japonica]